MSVIENMRQISALLKTLGVCAPSVRFADDDGGFGYCPGYATICGIDGSEKSTTFHAYESGNQYAIDAARVTIDGVEFHGQRPRNLTKAERAALDAIALERVATIIARGDVIALDVRAGVNLGVVLTAVEKLATRENMPVWFTFNDTEVTAKPGDTALQIGDAWAVARVRAGGVL